MITDDSWPEFPSNRKFQLVGLITLSFTTVTLFLTFCSDDSINISFDSSQTVEENIDSFIREYVGSDGPGISILVRQENNIAYKKSHGLANISTKIPVTSETPFYLASVSKQFTAMSTMLLYEQGLLSPDDRINKYITEAPDDWQDITIHQLLTHRSGIPDYLSDLNWYAPGITNDKILADLVVNSELEFAPGTQYDYSNSGYLILSIITLLVSGQPYEIFMRERIFEPLGMINTLVYDESKPDILGRAIGYTTESRLDDYSILTTGDGGMFSTIDDLDLWERSFYDNALVTSETKSKIFTSHENGGYGYGWDISEVKGHSTYHHGGGLNGYRSYISRVPEQKLSVIILSNGTFNWVGSLNQEILETLL